MKKNIFNWMTIMLMAFVVCVGFAACGSDDDDDDNNNGGRASSSLTGWWMTESWKGWDGYDFCEALHFINDNTVDYYSLVANGKYWTNNDIISGDYSAPFSGKAGWYFQKDCNVHYTYYIIDNILYMYNASDAMTLNFYNGYPNGFSKVK